MDMKQLQALLRAVEGSSAQHVQLETKDGKVTINRGTVTAKADAEAESPAPKGKGIQTPHHLDLKAPAEGAAAMARPSTAPTPQKNDIRSKHIGFFSRFNPKTKKQFFKLRDLVQEGDVVGVVRAMHIDMEVTADKSGKIVNFLVEEGQPVEYGQPLLRLE